MVDYSNDSIFKPINPLLYIPLCSYAQLINVECSNIHLFFITFWNQFHGFIIQNVVWYNLGKYSLCYQDLVTKIMYQLSRPKGALG